MTPEQDKLLTCIEDPGAAKVLAEIWRQIEGEPLAAARMLRAFQSANVIITDTLRELPAKWQALEDELTKADLHRARFVQDLREFRQSTSGELAEAIKDVRELATFFAKLDDDAFLNKANRILDLCDRLAKAKRDGSLENLRKLL